MIFPLVTLHCSNKQNAPKITGMFIDMCLENLTSNLLLLEKEDQLKRKIFDAEKIIDQK